MEHKQERKHYSVIPKDSHPFSNFVGELLSAWAVPCDGPVRGLFEKCVSNLKVSLPTKVHHRRSTFVSLLSGGARPSVGPQDLRLFLHRLVEGDIEVPGQKPRLLLYVVRKS